MLSDSNSCTRDTCNTNTGCVHNGTAYAGYPCDDDNACTVNDHCANANCVGAIPPECDDGDPCTADSCDEILGCRNTALPEGASCTDGNDCNGAETCQAGGCVAGPPPTNDTACEDGDLCTAGDLCYEGSCIAGPPVVCNDENPCTVDVCNEHTGCTYKGLDVNGDYCDDGNVCTTNDHCADERCVGALPPGCGDNNPCTEDTCSDVDGCQHASVPDWTVCDDGDGCNGTATCQAGLCTPSEPPAEGFPCSDGNPCTDADTCVNYVCTAGGLLDCDDLNACTVDGCSVNTGCTHNGGAANGMTCNDGDPCTSNDHCANSQCGGRKISGCR